jgi:hypothetical protein
MEDNTNTNITTEVVKKKRGRKPKNKNIEQSIDSQKQIEVIEKPPPKKRGRKPKGGKIILNETKPIQSNVIKQNVILHLKCNLKDIIEPENIFFDSIDDLNTTNKSSTLEYEIINKNINNSDFENNMINNTILHQEMAPEEKNNDNTNLFKDINSKLKDLQRLLHTNEISDKKSACFWCTYTFDNPSIYIPKYKIQNTYQCYGCFCSPECATSYLYNETIDTSVKFERYQLINYIYSKIYDYNHNIKPAPNPYYLLDKYFGNLTISEYRKLLRNDRLLMVIDKPLTRILPELHEETNNFMMTNQNEQQNAGIYKVKKKTKTNVTKNSIVNENFGVNIGIYNS